MLSRSAGQQNSHFFDQSQHSLNNVRSPFADSAASSHGGWDSKYDKEAIPPTPDVSGNPVGGMVVKEATNVVEDGTHPQDVVIGGHGSYPLDSWLLFASGGGRIYDWRGASDILAHLNAVAIFDIVLFSRLFIVGVCLRYYNRFLANMPQNNWPPRTAILNLQVAMHTRETDRYPTTSLPLSGRPCTACAYLHPGCHSPELVPRRSDRLFPFRAQMLAGTSTLPLSPSGSCSSSTGPSSDASLEPSSTRMVVL